MITTRNYGYGVFYSATVTTRRTCKHSPRYMKNDVGIPFKQKHPNFFVKMGNFKFVRRQLGSSSAEGKISSSGLTQGKLGKSSAQEKK